MLPLLRWVIGIGCVLGLLGFGLILVVGKGFEVYRSGSGGEDLIRAAITVGIPALLVAMLVTVAGTGGRVLLHVTAAGVVAAFAGCGVVGYAHQPRRRQHIRRFLRTLAGLLRNEHSLSKR